MKQRTFGNVIDDGTDLSASGTEFYKASDILSYATLNRAIENIFEDNENSYEILQNIVKALWGQNERGIIPDVFEEMDSSKLELNSILSEYFIRVPLGAFVIKLPDKFSNQYKYIVGESAQYDRNLFVDNDHNSFIVFNRPNINLFERQIADHLNINLNDEDNQVIVKYSFKDTNPNKVDQAGLDPNNTDYENNIIEYNSDRANIGKTIVYTADILTTKYEYKTVQSGGTAIETSVDDSNLNISLGSNIFETVNTLNNSLGNYLMKKDAKYSLEEIVPISTKVTYTVNETTATQTYSAYTNTKDLTSTINDYYLFYNLSPDNKPDRYKSNAEDNPAGLAFFAWYSYSGRFGIIRQDDYNCFNKTDDTSKARAEVLSNAGFDKDRIIPIFSFKLSNTSLGSVSSLLGGKIDRTKLNIRNLDVVNLINNLVLERKGNNYNISNSHYKEDLSSTTIGNINIGDNTLGYRQLNGADKDPSKYSQYYRDAIGNYNIAIGDKAMRNSAEPENNIAIGKNALINIGDGKNNIEIGTGSEVSVFNDSNINIGNNLKNISVSEKKITVKNQADGTNETKTVELSYNNVIGYGNLISTKLGTNNTIIGKDNTHKELVENNYIFGYNNTSNDTSQNSSNNYIFGYSNSGVLINDFIFGENNNLDEKSNNSVVLGDNNTITGSNTSLTIGKNNTVTSSNNANTFGHENKISSTLNSLVIGYSNTSKASTNNIFGYSNTSEQSDNLLIGISNTATASNNDVFGRSNTVSTGANVLIGKSNNIEFGKNVVVGRNNKLFSKNESFNGLAEDKDGNVIIGSGNRIRSDNNIILGKNNLIKNENNNVTDDIVNNIILGRNNTINKANNSIIIGNNYTDKAESNVFVLKPNANIKIYKTPSDSDTSDSTKESFFIKAYDTTSNIDDNVIINGYNIKINSKLATFAHDVTVNNELVSKYNIVVNGLKDNQTKSYTESGSEVKPVPIAGSLPSIAKFADYKSFIGNVDSDYYISIRPNNGYDSKDYAYIKIPSSGTGQVEVYSTINSGTKSIDYKFLDTSSNAQTKSGALTLSDTLTIGKQLTVNDGGAYIKGNSKNLYIFTDPNHKSAIYTDAEIYATSFIATSARAKKKNIVETTHHAIDEINKIKIVDFNFKTDINNENPKVGFIADDTDAIFSTKNHDSMDIYNCVGMLLKAVQELSAENEELKKKLS